MSDKRLTDEQYAALGKLADRAPDMLGLLDSYDRSRWLGRLLWKILLTIGATAAAVAAFGNHVAQIFKAMARGG